QMPENSLHNAKGVQGIKGQTLESSPHNGKSVHAQRIHNVEDAQEQIPGITPENSLQITEIVEENSPHNAEKQALENSLHNAEDKHKEKELTYNIESVQEKLTTQRRNAQGQALENLPHNAECAQGQVPESSHTMPNMPKDNARRFTTARTSTRKFTHNAKYAQGQCQKIYNVKDKHQRFVTPKCPKTNTRGSTMPNREFTLPCRECTETHYITSKVPE
ncbi:38180_t:CDS:2, partial [Gigaspora margarita]